ncbi:molybdopterin dinucleotide binding domain-containing protein, partial [Clavibacter michiganensis]|uniref:molybdopterin dinucleotide binding domain-containing protein n=1 Tax=Clavibacter michiganensis TaxID=28447 RepID=UPI002931D54F
VRLYGDGTFPTDIDRAETFGHDLLTGATVCPTNYSAMRVDGRAILKAAPYNPPHETPSDEYPLQYSTGRTVYQFHTRTKTGRARPLQRAATAAWVELSRTDAEARGIHEGDLVRVRSARGKIVVPARIGQVRDGCVFAPCHYGYWQDGRTGPDGHPTAANELTMTE